MPGPYKTEAVVLRSMRFAEADRILHLYTAARGRVNAIAKGVRRTGSRFGGRLEPLTHAALMLHEGRGELHTVSGADIVRSHSAVRERAHSLAVATIGAEAVLKLYVEPDPQPQVFAGLARFLDVLDEHVGEGDPSLDPVGLGFQLKLLLLAGYLDPAGSGPIEELVARPLGEVTLAPREARAALRTVEHTYEHHGGFQLRTLRA
jgi:DNA repair protein RecO (recombination protein O)